MTQATATRSATELAGMRVLASGYFRSASTDYRRSYTGGVCAALDWVGDGGGEAPASGEWRDADETGLRAERMAAERLEHAGRAGDAARFHGVVRALRWYLLDGDPPL